MIKYFELAIDIEIHLVETVVRSIKVYNEIEIFPFIIRSKSQYNEGLSNKKPKQKFFCFGLMGHPLT
ncbi:hypothetical protein EG351_09370 [Chryseobacterium bernardetii]|nr:hypothetical protein EG351_09370 [Chryseobacterium bernardetii]